MPEDYSPEEIEKSLQGIPEELKEVFFSLETAEAINNSCKKYGINDERVGQISDCVGQTLIGLIHPSDFQKTIKEKVYLPEVLAKAIAQEIDRLIFYPVKPALDELYETEATPLTKSSVKKSLPSEPSSPKTTPPREKPSAPSGPDTYREPIE